MFYIVHYRFNTQCNNNCIYHFLNNMVNEKRGIPRGPDSWGRILYEEEWGRVRRYNNPDNLLWYSISVFVGFLLLVLNFYYYFSSEPLAGHYVMVVIGFVTIFLGLHLMRGERSLMPFRVYEMGPTLRVLPSDRIRERAEVIIPKSSILKIDIQVPFGDVHFVVIEHADDSISPQKFAIRLRYLSNSNEALDALKKIVPDKFTKDAESYMEQSV